MQTRETGLIPFEIRFTTGEELGTEVKFVHENLTEEFNLLGRILIPAGKYDFRRNSVELGSAKQRNLWTTANYEWGGFWDGEKRTLEVTTGWQTRFRWIIRPGREVLVAWNSNITDPMDRVAVSESALRFKLKYNIRF